MNIEIDHPTDKVNFTIVTIGLVNMAFSYKTLVGVRGEPTGYTWKVHKNVWGPTTGKHLNWLDDGRQADRLTAAEFEVVAEKATRFELAARV